MKMEYFKALLIWMCSINKKWHGDAFFCITNSNNYFQRVSITSTALDVLGTALKPTHEAGRRGGDSIARRHVFNYQN